MLMHRDLVKHPIGVFGSSMLPEVLCGFTRPGARFEPRAGAAGGERERERRGERRVRLMSDGISNGLW